MAGLADYNRYGKKAAPGRETKTSIFQGEYGGGGLSGITPKPASSGFGGAQQFGRYGGGYGGNYNYYFPQGGASSYFSSLYPQGNVSAVPSAYQSSYSYNTPEQNREFYNQSVEEWKAGLGGSQEAQEASPQKVPWSKDIAGATYKGGIDYTMAREREQRLAREQQELAYSPYKLNAPATMGQNNINTLEDLYAQNAAADKAFRQQQQARLAERRKPSTLQSIRGRGGQPRNASWYRDTAARIGNE